MSDIFQGPGWWIASDGLWYPPEQHQDQAYRARFAESASLDHPEQFAEIEQQVVETTEMPAPDVESAATETIDLISRLQPEPAATETIDLTSLQPEPAATETIDLTSLQPEPAATETIDLTSLQSAPATSEVIAPEFSVAGNSLSRAPSRPVFDGTPAPSVGARTPAAPAPPSVDGRLKVEVGSRVDPDRTPKIQMQTPAIALSTSTEIEPLPASALGYVSLRERIVAGLLFLSGIAMIVGAFVNWTVGAIEETGITRGGGYVAIIAGIAGAAAAGPLAVGFRTTSIPRGVAIVAGSIGLMVVGLAVVTGVLDTPDVSVGPGIILEAVASAVMVLSAVAPQEDAPT